MASAGVPSALVPVEIQLTLLLSRLLTRSGCPTATSAACPFWVGMLFQIRTRLWPKSVTYSLWPSEVTATGAKRLEAVAVFTRSVAGGEVVKLGCPRTKSAACPLVVGILFQTMTR